MAGAARLEASPCPPPCPEPLPDLTCPPKSQCTPVCRPVASLPGCSAPALRPGWVFPSAPRSPYPSPSVASRLTSLGPLQTSRAALTRRPHLSLCTSSASLTAPAPLHLRLRAARPPSGPSPSKTILVTPPNTIFYVKAASLLLSPRGAHSPAQHSPLLTHRAFSLMPVAALPPLPAAPMPANHPMYCPMIRTTPCLLSSTYPRRHCLSFVDSFYFGSRALRMPSTELMPPPAVSLLIDSRGLGCDEALLQITCELKRAGVREEQ